MAQFILIGMCIGIKMSTICPLFTSKCQHGQYRTLKVEYLSPMPVFVAYCTSKLVYITLKLHYFTCTVILPTMFIRHFTRVINLLVSNNTYDLFMMHVHVCSGQLSLCAYIVTSLRQANYTCILSADIISQPLRMKT